MSNLRETKKRATRQAIADAAGRIYLAEGAEALTVSHVAEQAGVSARTFHNYYSSLNECLAQFALDAVSSIAEKVDEYPAQATTTEIFEDIVCKGFRTAEPELHSVASLSMVMDYLDKSCFSGVNRDEAKRVAEQVSEAFSRHSPERDAFDTEVVLHACAAVSASASKAFFALPEPRDPEVGEQMVRRAFATLRSIT
ncbi:TetR/AcrR family transcriptional regulator [Corynebacterium confusum]|uniref:TetR/AcrR family transcriptional regulator n=1 Tax=uncultured Corynebacterium sp. TaxID=159447 RepID=UPI0025E0BB55|nr:TetR/AcrR family transcriptional regulator [uncultured Corynebacterium sp.]